MIALSPISREKSYMCVRLKKGGGDGKAPNQHFSSPPKECFAFAFGKLDSTREHHTAGAKVADLMFTVVIIRRKQKKKRRGIVSGRWVMINIKVIIIFLAALSRSRTTTNQKKKLKLFARAIKRQKFFYPLNVSAWERLRLRCGGGWKGSNIKFCLCLPVQIRFSRFVGWGGGKFWRMDRWDASGIWWHCIKAGIRWWIGLELSGTERFKCFFWVRRVNDREVGLRNC